MPGPPERTHAAFPFYAPPLLAFRLLPDCGLERPTPFSAVMCPPPRQFLSALQETLQNFFSECGPIAEVRLLPCQTVLLAAAWPHCPSCAVCSHATRHAAPADLGPACPATHPSSYQLFSNPACFQPSCVHPQVRIAYDRDTGRSRGFAHVQFEEVEGAAKAIQLSGQVRLLPFLSALFCPAVRARQLLPAALPVAALRCTGELHVALHAAPLCKHRPMLTSAASRNLIPLLQELDGREVYIESTTERQQRECPWALAWCVSALWFEQLSSCCGLPQNLRVATVLAHG